jgi:pilus assembly protein CpaB
MKNLRALIVLGVAIVTGLVAVVMAARWMTQQAGERRQVVVATRDADLGTQLDPATMLTTVSWPSGAIPEGSYADPKELQGRVLKTPLSRNEPVLETKLTPKGTKGGLSAIIAEGRRAITVRVNEVVGVAGFALPGSFVDVMVHTTTDDTPHGKGAPVSRIVLERILVLAVAQEAGRDDTKPKVVNAVTLEVTPEQAELLDVARSVGNLSLVLRNQMDQAALNTAGRGKPDLFPRTAPPTPAPPPPAPVVARRAAPKPVAAAAPAPATAPPAPAPAPAPQAPAREEPPKIEVIRGVARSTAPL